MTPILNKTLESIKRGFQGQNLRFLPLTDHLNFEELIILFQRWIVI